jgi:hypothetical protein
VLAAISRIMLVEVDAGHNVAGDNPDRFHGEVRKFLTTGVAGTKQTGIAPAGAVF